MAFFHVPPAAFAQNRSPPDFAVLKWTPEKGDRSIFRIDAPVAKLVLLRKMDLSPFMARCCGVEWNDR